VKNIAQKVAQCIFAKLMHNLYHGKSSPKMWVTSVIFKKLPKVNNYPLGENSPNLVTLPGLKSQALCFNADLQITDSQNVDKNY
jgi:hypothetical protein